MKFKLLKRIFFITLILLAAGLTITFNESGIGYDKVQAAPTFLVPEHKHDYSILVGQNANGHTLRCEVAGCLKRTTVSHDYKITGYSTDFHGLKCSVCNRETTSRHTYFFHKKTEDDHTLKCACGRTSTASHEYDEKHICTQFGCGKFNNGEDFNGHSYDTHRFTGGKCVLCDVKLEATGGTFLGLKEWTSYSPTDYETSAGGSVTIITNYPPYDENGEYAEFKLFCSRFARQDAAWHAAVAREENMASNDYIGHLGVRGKLGLGSAEVIGVANGNTITFSGMPSGGPWNTSYSGMSIYGLSSKRFADGGGSSSTVYNLKIEHVDSTSGLILQKDSKSATPKSNYTANVLTEEQLKLSGKDFKYDNKFEVYKAGDTKPTKQGSDKSIKLEDINSDMTVRFYYSPELEVKVTVEGRMARNPYSLIYSSSGDLQIKSNKYNNTYNAKEYKNLDMLGYIITYAPMVNVDELANKEFVNDDEVSVEVYNKNKDEINSSKPFLCKDQKEIIITFLYDTDLNVNVIHYNETSGEVILATNCDVARFLSDAKVGPWREALVDLLNKDVTRKELIKEFTELAVRRYNRMEDELFKSLNLDDVNYNKYVNIGCKIFDKYSIESGDGEVFPYKDRYTVDIEKIKDAFSGEVLYNFEESGDITIKFSYVIPKVKVTHIWEDNKGREEYSRIDNFSVESSTVNVESEDLDGKYEIIKVTIRGKDVSFSDSSKYQGEINVIDPEEIAVVFVYQGKEKIEPDPMYTVQTEHIWKKSNGEISFVENEDIKRVKKDSIHTVESKSLTQNGIKYKIESIDIDGRSPTFDKNRPFSEDIIVTKNIKIKFVYVPEAELPPVEQQPSGDLLFEFRVTDVVDDEDWQDALFKTSTDEYGADKLPVGKEEQVPPKPPYGIKLGSTFKFRVASSGENNDSIRIKPQIYFVSQDGKNPEDVTNKEEFKVTYNKVETNLSDCEYKFVTNLSKHTSVNGYSKVRVVQEITNVLKSNNINTKLDIEIGTLEGMKISKALRMPYLDKEGKAEFEDNRLGESVTDEVFHWYGEYFLPSTTEYEKDGVKQKGYFIVCFKIESLDSTGAVHLEYEDQFVGNQWVNEGYSNSRITLPNGKNVTLNIANGYYPVIIYDSTVSVGDDFSSVGTH